MEVIKLVNEYGAVVIRCAKHLEPVRKHIYGKGTETVVEGECEDCLAEQRQAEAPAKMLDFILNDPNFSHTRFRPFGSNGYVTAYKRDATSPSGVLAVCSLDEKRFNELVYPKVRNRAGGSPLSPTESGGGMK